MRQLYLEYKEKSKIQQLVGEIQWVQNLLILSKIKDDNEKLYHSSGIHGLVAVNSGERGLIEVS